MTTPRENMDILDVLLAARDEGQALSLPELKLRFPGQEQEVERLWLAAASYERGVPEAQAPCGVSVGDRLGDFLLEQLLGAGGMGQVFLALQQSLGHRRVALKVLPGVVDGDVNLRRFEREAVLVAELHHPRLAEVYAFGEDRGIHFIAMRYIAGRSLSSVLDDVAARRVELTFPELQKCVLRWAIDVAEALVVVHTAGLVHRDVKPSNIMLEGTGTTDCAFDESVVLVDFGLVRKVDSAERTQTGFSAATPAYASPEQLLNVELDSSSDVFSLGVTLHDLLARRQPRDRGQASAGLEDLLALCPDVNHDFSAVIAKMVDPEPRWRYADGADLLADLQALRAGERVSARFPPAMERLRRWIDRDPAAILRFGVAAVALVAAMIAGSIFLGSASAAREARQYWDSGDLPALSRSARSIGFQGRWLVREPLVREALDDLGGDSPDAPLYKISGAFERRDTLGALLEIATRLRVEGLDSNPFLSRVLVRALDMESRAGRSPEAGQSPALRMVTRLFFERPVEQAEDREACAPFRRALRDRWQLVDQSLDERLLILSAFSGLGELDDVTWILEWASTHPVLSEERRLAFFVCERILRRTVAVADSGEIEHENLRRLVLEVATPSYRETFGDSWQLAEATSTNSAAAELVRALATLRRHYGLAAGIESVLPPDRDMTSLATAHRVMYLRAADQDEDFLSVLGEAKYPPNLSPGSFNKWGEYCGLAGAALELESVRGTARGLLKDFETSAASSILDSFDQGVSKGRALLYGIATHYDPDQDTRMGAGGDSPPWLSLPLLRAPLQEGPTQGGGRLLAVWKFEQDSLTAGGTMLGLSGRSVQLSVDERARSYFLMSQPGRSELQARFRVEEDPGLEDWTLVVRYQVGARVYLPYRGQAILEFFVDGKPLDAGRVLFGRPLRNLRTGLPWELIPRGEHVLSLRLNPTTNTTFRVHSLELWAPN